MNNSSLIELLEIFLSIVLLLWFFRGPWQSLLVDMTRQRLFEARDKLFLYAANGGISFDSSTYNEIRGYLNSSIRLCHRFSLASVIASIFSKEAQQTNTGETNSIFNTVKEIDNIELRTKVEELLFESVGFISLLMVLRSFILFPLVVIITPFMLIYILLRGHFKQLLTKMAPIIERDVRMGDT